MNRNHSANTSAHPFAPGAIEHHRRAVIATPSQWRALVVWGQRLAAFMATVALIAFAVGYIAAATATTL